MENTREYKNPKFPEYELKQELRVRYIANDIVAGMSKRKIVEKYTEAWNMSKKHIYDYYNEALSTLTDEEGLAKLREVNTERLLDLYDAACKQGDVKSQLKAIDLINRTNNIYRTNISIGQEPEFVFNFTQGEQNNPEN